MELSLLGQILATFCLVFVIRRLLWMLTHRLAPGPWNLPILGYPPFFVRLLLRKPQVINYKELAKKYGNIFGLHLGTRYTIVLNDFADIKDALNKEEYTDRPEGWFAVSDHYDHLVNMNGWEWKETRKFVVTSLRNLGVGKNKVEESIKEEISQMIKKIEKAEPGTEANLLDVFYLPLLNVIMTLTFGRPFDDGEKLLKMMAQYNEEIIKEIVLSHGVIFFPFLKPLVWIQKRLRPSLKPAVQEMENFVRKETESHMREFDENNLDDFTAYYLNEMKKITSTQTSITLANLLGNSQGLMFAGTDTTRVTMTWVVLHLAHYQEFQEKMYKEIVKLLGKEKPPSWSDKDDLPYTNAFIWESARVKTLAPAEDPHWSTKDGTIGGYFIPKDSIVLPNVEAVHNDEKLWGDPQNFRPERFLSADGTKATLPEYWIPFLIGKRVCPGAKLANMQLFLFVASLVQNFHIVAPKSGLNIESQHIGLTFPVKPVVSFNRRA